MPTERRIHKISPILVNGTKIVKVVIDSHYEKKHSDHITDALILKLVQKLDCRFEVPEVQSGGFSYFVTLIEVGSKLYRLIRLLEEHAVYIGVVNAFRDKRRK